MLVEQAPRVWKEEGEATTWLKTRHTRQIRDSHRHRQSFVVLMQEKWVLWRNRNHLVNNTRRRQGQDVERATPTLGR